ncbi:hypothetical protein NE865_06007 [Phthorimaea operculella]|nr:hypothetical protein NE865_06007 [Phthorimaea operculella]
MNFNYKIEKVLLTVTGVLCTVLVVKLLYSLRTILPWRVNCWFCNCNYWVKFFERNSWTCPKCEQYNGFTKDGDYNKPLITNTNEQPRKAPKMLSSPPSNGLCKMCNINQQLKVTQLANFVPMNDKSFDEEIESYRMQLEKAYRLCSPCKKVLQMKLHKEKEVLLGTKVLEARTPDKKAQKQDLKNQKISNFIHSMSIYIAGAISILVAVECYSNITKNRELLNSLNSTKDILYGILERIFSIIKIKMLMTFPILETYLIDVNFIHIDKWPKHLDLVNSYDKVKNYNILTQEALLGLVVLIQAFGYVWSKYKVKSAFATDFLWATFGITCIVHHLMGMYPTIMSLGKLSCLLAVILAHKSKKTYSGKIKKFTTSPNIMKNISNQSMKSQTDEDLSMETDDDVSLSQYGLHNFSESSNDTSPLNNSLINGRSFTPRSENSMWTKPKLNSTMNSTFCVNSQKSPSSVSETVFSKPVFQQSKEASFHKYQKLNKDDSDSDLDESISSLCIGSPKKKPKKTDSIFALRKFTATPNFVAPTPLTRRPLISPSKLGHSTSWVAGGYWGNEGERQFNDGSRSSSQSSGFESQASSVNRNHAASQPSSREESDCGDLDRNPLLDRFQNCNMSNCSSFRGSQHQPIYSNYQGHGMQTPQCFSRISSPVFPQMQYNSHVQIPQPRFAQQCVPNVFGQKQFGHDPFKAPGGSGLIRLPQGNFSSR